MARVSGGAHRVPKDRADLLDNAWTEAAQLYLQELVPRFDPWLQSALRELKQHTLPPGPIVVPCCGPGHELVLLHRLYGGKRAVYGIDLSQGMVELAREAIRAYQEEQQQQAVDGAAAAAAPLDVHVADASCIAAYGPAAAVLSVFGLQQMAQVAPQALASWARSLVPGGVAVVVLWPSNSDPAGPWALFDQVVMEKSAADASRAPPAAGTPASELELRLTEPVLRDVEGVQLLADRLEPHRIEWDSIEHLWKVMSEGGPWRARRLAQGDAVMRDLEARLVDKFHQQQPQQNQQQEAAGELQQLQQQNQQNQQQQQEAACDLQQQQQHHQQQRLVHSPTARIIVLRRRTGESHGGRSDGGEEGEGGGEGPCGAAPADAPVQSAL